MNRQSLKMIDFESARVRVGELATLLGLEPKACSQWLTAR